MAAVERVVALDVGEKRIGVAVGDSQTKIAVPEITLSNDDDFIANLGKLLEQKQPSVIVVGLPRNSQGQETQQSQYVRQFAKSLNVFNLPIEFQDESLTSVEAETLLKSQSHTTSTRKPKVNQISDKVVWDENYNKQQIDAMAAALILTDYLETKYAR